MAVNKRGLGKGLDTMIPPVKNEKKSEKGDPAKGPETLVNITKVEPNREQPRKNFDEMFKRDDIHDYTKTIVKSALSGGGLHKSETPILSHLKNEFELFFVKESKN